MHQEDDCVTFRGSGMSHGWCRGTSPRLSTVRQQLGVAMSCMYEVLRGVDYPYFLIGGGGWRKGWSREGRVCVEARWRGGRGGVPI